MNHDGLRRLFARIKSYILWGTIFWTVIIALSLLWNILYTKNQIMAKADVKGHVASLKPPRPASS